VKWADPCVEVFEVYRAGVVRGCDGYAFVRGSVVFSPTHKRTEGRAPVWGSEITSEDATLQGKDERENRIRKISTLAMRCLIFKLFILSGSKPIQKTQKQEKTEKNKKINESKI